MARDADGMHVIPPAVIALSCRIHTITLLPISHRHSMGSWLTCLSLLTYFPACHGSHPRLQRGIPSIEGTSVTLLLSTIGCGPLQGWCTR
jgi:hypothetical protein